MNMSKEEAYGVNTKEYLQGLGQVYKNILKDKVGSTTPIPDIATTLSLAWIDYDINLLNVVHDKLYEIYHRKGSSDEDEGRLLYVNAKLSNKLRKRKEYVSLIDSLPPS